MEREKRQILVFFFFQAEDGIRDIGVTGVQTCALPICSAVRVFKAWSVEQINLIRKARLKGMAFLV